MLTLVRLAPWCENDNSEALLQEFKPPSKGPDEEREIDYLICRQCHTPCYIFEMDGNAIAEAQCLVCGNEEVSLFAVGEDVGSDD